MIRADKKPMLLTDLACTEHGEDTVGTVVVHLIKVQGQV